MDKQALEKLLQQGQDNALLRYTLGTTCLKEGLLADAEDHLAVALRLDPKHSASWKAYGKTLTELGRLHDAIHAYREGIAVAGSRGDVQAAKEMSVFLRRLEKKLEA